MQTTHNGIIIPELDANGRPFSLDLSPWAIGEYVKELPRIPPGYFALPGKARLKDTDQYLGSDWTYTSSCGERVSRDKFVYIRRITSDPELYNRMIAYANNKDNTPDTLQTKLENARNEVKRLEEEIKKENEYIVEVVVEGTTYKSEYHEEYVQFGCAKIDKVLLREAYYLVKSSQGVNGNRTITGIQIGKGLFTSEQICKMATKMKVN